MTVTRASIDIGVWPVLFSLEKTCGSLGIREYKWTIWGRFLIADIWPTALGSSRMGHIGLDIQKMYREDCHAVVQIVRFHLISEQ